jgi:hypothetical protein
MNPPRHPQWVWETALCILLTSQPCEGGTEKALRATGPRKFPSRFSPGAQSANLSTVPGAGEERGASKSLCMYWMRQRKREEKRDRGNLSTEIGLVT